MSISSALQSAISGLGTNSRMLEVVSDNLANQLTDGYAARSTVLGSVAGGVGGGVRVVSVERATDPELTAMRRHADAEAARGQVLADAARTLASALGETSEAGSLIDRLRSFETALGALADTPESAPRQSAAAIAAADLAASFVTISDRANDLRNSADAAIAAEVEGINTALGEIARLNRQIQVFTATGRETGALEDERERQIDRVAAALPVRETRHDDGRIELRTEQGLTLVDTRAHLLEFTPTPVISPQMSYAGGTGALSGLMLGGVDIAPGSGRAQSITDGGLVGLFAVRDAEVPAFQAKLDALAMDLIRRGDLGGLDPTTPPGAPGLFTDAGAAFDPANLTGLSGRIALNPAVDPNAGGDPARLRDGLGAGAPGPSGNDTLLRALSDAFAERTDASDVLGLSGQLSLDGRIAGVMELTASTRVARETELGALSAARTTLAAQEGRERAVNEDAELAHLLRIEQAFAANSQVIQAAARMLDELTRI
ncbi:flagellar hook-associated protein FlgK [Limibaculum sp. M0105]|uniref:Flagellar hook-associated protein 1 n=1 Tax=Thermohalobaculum xanthum TaxID=2753746 RepID=A0A8J7MBG1_9RHOB|nr:flagellar hook-associated protein FlgK [Thermohalobaculum xanthum]MBK0401167.1 flagellar hook-associated protein FlgK [Thermohalobaculum xanthum]